MNVHIHAYGDPALCEQAIQSVPDSMPVHVFDGRYRSFAGDTDLTPGLAEICESYGNATYHEPPAETLPFGDPEKPGEYRAPQHEKTTWAWSRLPADDWTLKLDADEELACFDADLDELDRSKKHRVNVSIPGDPDYPDALSTRLWVPEHWTFWTDDLQVPRDDCPRTADAAEVKTAIDQGAYKARQNLGTRDDIVIENIGHERPASYLARREAQLEIMYGG